MKQLITIFLVALALTAHAAADPGTRTTTLAQLNGTDPAGVGDQILKSEVDRTHAEVKIVITNVTQQQDIDQFTFSFDNKDIDKTTLVNPYDAAAKTYTIVITSQVGLMALNTLKTFAIKKGGALRWTVDVKSGDTGAADATCSQIDFQNAAQAAFDMHILPAMKLKYGLVERTGLYIDKSNVVHLFIDNFGKYYGHGAPTVATEQYSYQVHILTAACLKASYGFDFTGIYSQQLNIDSDSQSSAKAQGSGANAITIEVKDFAVIGPFTDKFSFNLTRTVATKTETLVSPTIPVAKMYHVSITAGLLATTLKNPQNISKAPLNTKGDTTLVADNPKTRGLLSIMAIYYPAGRSFLYPPSGGPFDISRIGIVVGTQLGDAANENFLLGLSHDFARGGAITYGLHFGDRNVVSGAPNFKYGTDTYTLPALNVKKQWDVGFFFGVSVDMRVALQLIKSLGTSL